jgi:type VI secretion system secreted protein VgrG
MSASTGGSIQVRFPWVSADGGDSASSHWVRLDTTFAGKRWGFISVPRIGQEVLVIFEEGDPDRPLIIGTVYNADRMPVAPLPTTSFPMRTAPQPASSSRAAI